MIGSMPLWLRLLLALLLGSAAVVGLALTVGGGGAAAAVTPVPPAPVEDVAPLPPLPRQHQPVTLLGPDAEVPAAAAPVLELLAGGEVRVRRAAPLPLRPDQAPDCEPALRLPVADIAALTPRQRGGFCECLSALCAERPVRLDHLRTAGVHGRPEDWAALLGWVR